MKQKKLNAIVDARYAEAVAVQRKSDAFLLAMLCDSFSIAVPSNDGGYLSVKVCEDSTIDITIRYMNLNPDVRKVYSPDDPEFVDFISQYENSIMSLFQEKREYLLGRDGIDFTANVPKVCSYPSKQAIRLAVINEHKNRWLVTPPAHHVRNNKHVVRGHHVSSGYKNKHWKVRHDNDDSVRYVPFVDNYKKYSRKERKCSVIRNFKRFGIDRRKVFDEYTDEMETYELKRFLFSELDKFERLASNGGR